MIHEDILNNNTKDIIEEQKASSILLKNLAVNFEEQLYDIKIQLKTRLSLLNTKESELLEQERTKVYNRDLFSPNSYISNNDNELEKSIEQLKKEIEELNNHKDRLKENIDGLKTAAHSIDLLIRETQNKSTNRYRNNISDNGLSILEAQEAERQRIARELHDSTVQSLTSLVHKSELSVKLIDIDIIRAKLELNSMSNTLKTVINDMRGIIYNLKPMTLEDLGLTITIQRFANKIMDTNNVQVRVKANEEKREILPVIKLTIFRIIQEACNNTLKHANASIIDIEIEYQERIIIVIIKDNGEGFKTDYIPVNTEEEQSSFGLSIMRERTSLLSGTLDIQSEQHKGTIITIKVPLNLHEEDEDESAN